MLNQSKNTSRFGSGPVNIPEIRISSTQSMKQLAGQSLPRKPLVDTAFDLKELLVPESSKHGSQLLKNMEKAKNGIVQQRTDQNDFTLNYLNLMKDQENNEN